MISNCRVQSAVASDIINRVAVHDSSFVAWESGMIVEVTSFVLGAAAGSLVVVSIAYPRVGRIFARVLALVALSLGIGLLTWAIHAAITGEPLAAIAWERIAISQPGEAFAWSAGLLVGGIIALLLSFAGRTD